MARRQGAVPRWWLRTVLVLQSPRAVFVALRDDSPEAASNRAEPVLLIVLLAGIAFVLSTRTAAHLMDDHDYDGSSSRSGHSSPAASTAVSSTGSLAPSCTAR